MDFPLTALMDEDACYAKLVAALHPSGLACPRCGEADRLGVHRRHHAPVLDYPDGRQLPRPRAWRPSYAILAALSATGRLPRSNISRPSRRSGC